MSQSTLTQKVPATDIVQTIEDAANNKSEAAEEIRLTVSSLTMEYRYMHHRREHWCCLFQGSRKRPPTRSDYLCMDSKSGSKGDGGEGRRIG